MASSSVSGSGLPSTTMVFVALADSFMLAVPMR